MNPVRILKIKDVVAIVGYSRSSIYRLVKICQFPPPVRLGAHAIGWRSDSIQSWIDSRPYRNEAGEK
ncbi:MAG: AlpA family phage regulatory protein [Burkholderiales bacterium]|nr:AlpA family phage regulatory protein [Burkholderiales bacterium]